MKKHWFAGVLFVLGCAGSSGLDGRNALVKVSAEPESSACEYGGIKIESGVDLDDSGALEPQEVDDTQYVCDGAPGPDASLTRASEEPAGTNCPSGGVRLELGLDTNDNGSLGDDEVQDTEYVCNGSDGTDGEDGMDGRAGQDGTPWLTSVSPVPANDACGTTEGLRVEVGPDINGNDALDPAEVTGSELVCDGEDGQDGMDGMSGSGGGAVVETYYLWDRVVSSNGADVTLAQLSMTAPGPGTLVVIGTTDAFCSTSGMTDYECASSFDNIGHVRIVDTPGGAPDSGDQRSYFYVADDTTESISRTAVYNFSTGGTRTFYLRATADTGEIGFWRNQLTLIFLPE